jgi:uncharacterized protein involved in exopolysaccharide biosynthesis
MEVIHSKRLNVIHLLNILFKHKSKILASLFITGVVTVLVSFSTPRLYEAKSTVMVQLGREFVYRPEFGDPVTGTRYRLAEVINSETQILNSSDLRERVLETIGISGIYPDMVDKENPMEFAVRALGEGLVIKSIADSNIIHVFFKHQDPAVAANVLNELIKEFLAKHVQVFGESRAPFLEEQMRTYEEQLDEAESELEAFRQKHGVFDIADQTRLLLKQRSDLSVSMNSTNNEIKELEQKIATLDEQLKKVPKNIPVYTETETNSTLDELKVKLMELQIEEQKLLGTYTENSLLVRNIRDEIASVASLMKSQGNVRPQTVRTGMNPVYEEIELDSIHSRAKLQSMYAKKGVIESQIWDVNRQLSELDIKQKGLRELERKVDTYERNHTAYVNKLEEALALDAMDRMKRSSIRIIESAKVPIKPLGLSLKMRLALGMLLGLIAGIGIAIIAEFNQRRLSNVYAVEQRLQLPVLTVLPERR